MYPGRNTHSADGVPGWEGKGNISFIAQLGDVIDGINKDLGASESALQTILAQVSVRAQVTHEDVHGTTQIYTG